MHPRPDDIINELSTIAPALAEVSRENVYTVPFLYFLQFPLAMLNRVNQQAAASSSTLQQVNPFSLPAGYFENFPQAVLQQVKAKETITADVYTELDTIAPLLNTISKKTVYTIPTGYFDTLSIVPGDRPVQAKNHRSILKTLYRYAAAAVLTGILIMGAIFFTNDNKTVAPGSASIANIIVELGNVSDTEIATYLENNDFAVEGNNASFAPTDELPIQEFIKSLSEEEIKQYLKENATSNKEI